MINYYLLSPLPGILKLLFGLTPPSQNPSACFTSSLTLATLVDCFTDFTVPQEFYGPSSYSVAQPIDEQREAWYTAASRLLDTDNDCTSTIIPSAIGDIYSFQLFTDADGSSFCVLYEQTIFDSDPRVFQKGWGFMIVPSTTSAVARHIHISGPHPFADGVTNAQATQLFKETGAKSLLIPGRHRHAYTRRSDCVESPANTTYSMTDPTHNDLEPFFDANLAIYDWQMGYDDCPSATCAFIQLHGKANDSCSNDAIFLSTGLPTNHTWYKDAIDRPIKRLKEQLHRAFNSGSGTTPVVVSLPSGSNCNLTATKNVFGRYLNNHLLPHSREVCRTQADPALVRGWFIHAEQSRFARGPDGRAAWVDALKNTFAAINT